MKKFILLIFFPVIISGCTLITSNTSQSENNKDTKTIEAGKLSKYNCEQSQDCAISSYDPEGFETCVNKNWNEWLNEEPQVRGGVSWECLNTKGLECGCINNKCERVDSKESCK